jgi:hypothetical protein
MKSSMPNGVWITACAALALCACSKRQAPGTDGDAPVSIVATDSGFVVADTLHEGLNHLVYENRGSTIHECMFIRLPDAMGAHEYIEAVKAGYAFPEGAIDCSGPGLTSPGQRVEMWVSLERGRYLLGCWVAKHLTSVSPRTVVVHGAPKFSVTPPREDATLKLVDFRFELSPALQRGARTIRVETVGPSMHEVDCFRLESGRTIDDIRNWYHDQEGPLRAIALGGVLDSHDLSRVVWLRRTFEAGHYVLWCDMPMIQSGNDADAGAAADVTHDQAGMVLEFEVAP